MWCPEGDLNPHAKGGGHPQNSNVFHRFFVLLMALLCHLLCQQAPDRAERARDYMPWHKKTSPAHMEGMTANNTITTMSDALATDRPTLTVKEVASLLGVDVRTVYRAIDEEQLPSLQVGTKRLIPRLKLMALLGADVA